MFGLEIRTETETGICPKHGKFENVGIIVGNRIVWGGCSECGAERIELENRSFAMEAERQRNRRLFASAALPRRFESKTLSSYRVEHKGHENAIRTALAYVSEIERNMETGAGLLLYGANGTGKTHIAIGIALEFLEAGRSAMYARASAAIREVKETWGKKASATETEIYRKYAEPDLLVIDEIGRQFGTDSEKIILFEIINARYEQMKPTIAITNLDGANLADFLGGATLDRLKEHGRSVCFDWESMRPKV